MPVEFLMQQMEWREALDDARAHKSRDELDELDNAIRAARKTTVGEIGVLLDADDFTQAAGLVRQLMFLEKFAEEVSHALDALPD